MHIMKAVCVFLFLTSIACAELDKPLVSPTKQFVILNIREADNSHFEIRDIQGRAVLSALTLKELDPLSVHALDAVWSPDGISVAVTVRISNYVHDVLVLTYVDGVFVPILTPDCEPDYSSNAIRWKNAQDLILEINGPWGGKFTDAKEFSFNSFQRTIRISIKQRNSKTIIETKRSYPYRQNVPPYAAPNDSPGGSLPKAPHD